MKRGVKMSMFFDQPVQAIEPLLQRSDDCYNNAERYFEPKINKFD